MEIVTDSFTAKKSLFIAWASFCNEDMMTVIISFKSGFGYVSYDLQKHLTHI